MDFKSALFIFLSLICQISAQSGSSFFYYYSPKQPMIINSQTFGTNAQAHQRLLPPSSNNPFNFNLNPSTFSSQQQQQQQHSQSQNPYPTETPFIPQRNAFPTLESIREKIAFTNAPAVAAQLPQFRQPQDQTSTSDFPGQQQPSGKLFNFLNQPFQFFQNSFNRFPQAETTSSPPPPQAYYTPQHQNTRLIANTPPINDYNQNQQHFYNYYSRPQPTQSYETDPPVGIRGNAVERNPSRNYNQNHVQGEPVSYAVNQYYSSKNAQGPTTSYSLTIGADPTTGPTATVHVSMGHHESDTNRFLHPRPPTSFVPQRFNNNQQQGRDPIQIHDIAQSIEVEDTPIQDPSLEIRNSYNANTETETLTTTTSSPEVILMVVTAAEPALVSSTTLNPDTISTTLPTITSSTTTTTAKPTVPAKVDEYKAPKRIIIRKKISRKRIRNFVKNRTLTVSVLQPTQDNTVTVLVDTEANVANQHVPSTTPSELPFESTTQKRLRTRTRITSTSKQELIEATTPSALITDKFNTPEDYASSTEPVTTPYSLPSDHKEVKPLIPVLDEITTSIQPLIESTTEALSKIESHSGSPSSDAYPVYDENDYEYYYHDGDTHSSNEFHDTSRPIVPQVQSTSTPATDVTLSTNKNNDKYDSSATTVSSLTEFEEHTSQLPEEALEEEIIEPLSTTETQTVSSTEGAFTEMPEQNTTPDTAVLMELSSSTSTEKIEATTESISIIFTTTEASFEQSKPVPDQMINKQIDQSTEKLLTLHEEKKERPTVDYSNDPVLPEADPEDIKPLNATQDVTSVTVIPEEKFEDFPDEYIYSQEEYTPDPHAEEKIKETQRLAHQNALKNIRSRIQNTSTTTTETPEEDSKKFVRRPTKVVSFPSSSSSSSSQNTYDDEEIGDSRTQIIQKIQTFRTKLRRVASSRSVVSNYNSNSVRSTTKRPRRVTRPSDRSTSSTTLATFPNQEDEEGTNLGEFNEVATNPKLSGKPNESFPKESEPEPVKSTTRKPTQIVHTHFTTNTSTSEDVFSNVNYDVNELDTPNSENIKGVDSSLESDQQVNKPKPTQESKPKIVPESESPKNVSLHVGELIIHEILPTQSTTTETQPKNEDGTEASTESLEAEVNFDENTDFQTYSMEDEIEGSSERPSDLKANSKKLNATSSVSFTTSEIATNHPELESITITNQDVISSSTPSTTIEPSPELITATSVSVETNTSNSESRPQPQRKVKVILKRKKGSPPGSGTIARQVVRTRTRLRQKVPAAV